MEKDSTTMTINTLGLSFGQRGFSFGLGLAVGLGFTVHGAAASGVSTACRGSGTTKQPVARTVAHPAPKAQLFVSGQHRWRLSLQRVTVVPQVQGSSGTYHAKGKYVVVVLGVQNVGKAPQTLYFDQDFALTDAQGRQFGTAASEVDTAAVEQYKVTDPVEDVQPTFSAHVAFVFDVAADARGLTLMNVPSFGGATQKHFTLGI
jgi:hypothetical protein